MSEIAFCVENGEPRGIIDALKKERKVRPSPFNQGKQMFDITLRPVGKREDELNLMLILSGYWSEQVEHGSF